MGNLTLETGKKYGVLEGEVTETIDQVATLLRQAPAMFGASPSVAAVLHIGDDEWAGSCTMTDSGEVQFDSYATDGCHTVITLHGGNAPRMEDDQSNLRQSLWLEAIVSS